MICVEDSIDSSKDAGKLMISVLSAVAEIGLRGIRVKPWKVVSRKGRSLERRFCALWLSFG